MEWKYVVKILLVNLVLFLRAKESLLCKVNFIKVNGTAKLL